MHLVVKLRPELTIIVERQHVCHFAVGYARRIDAGVIGPFGAIGNAHQVIDDVAGLAVRLVWRGSGQSNDLRTDASLFADFPHRRLFRGLARVDPTLGKDPLPLRRTTEDNSVAPDDYTARLNGRS